MYEGEHYELMVKKLQAVTDEMSFRKTIEEFDREAGFNYQDEKNGYFRIYEYPLSYFTNKKGQIDMSKKTYYDKFFSDYIFLLNLSGKNLLLKEYESIGSIIVPQEITTFYFGTFRAYHDRYA